MGERERGTDGGGGGGGGVKESNSEDEMKRKTDNQTGILTCGGGDYVLA